jgi:hypothetical protein
MKALIAALLLLSPVAALAQSACVQGAAGTAPVATIAFTAPTTNTDGTAISTPLTYNLYMGTATGTETKIASGATGSPIAVNTGLKPAATYYFQVTVVDAHGVESPRSNEVCKAFPASTPSTVVITIT